MATSVEALLGQHPTNPVNNPLYKTRTNKTWAHEYAPITKVTVHTSGPDGAVVANFDGPFMEEYADDVQRMREIGYPPNLRNWRLEQEEDGVTWFHTEVSNVVLAAWSRFPCILQASQAKPLNEKNVKKAVDITYSFRHNRRRVPLVVGEMKRNLIIPDEWRGGKIAQSDQKVLSQELRGYACEYDCPQVFCFDHEYLLMLQFRAREKSDMRKPDCEIDCWVFPRRNDGGCTLRYAFYRLLVQGFRRCQSVWALDVAIGGLRPAYRQFYSGRPLWKIEGKYHLKPWDHHRAVDPESGAFYWMYDDNPVIINDQTLWDTAGFWQVQPPVPVESQGQTMDEDEIYAAD